MSDIRITVESGKTKRLLTEGKLCNENIVVSTPTVLTQEKTASASVEQAVIVTPDDGKLLSKVTINQLDELTPKAPRITVSATGLVRADYSTGVGYVSQNELKFATKQLDPQPSQTITPSAISQMAVEKGMYTTGDVVVAGDSNLKPENIKNGVSIFGVAGSLVVGSLVGESLKIGRWTIAGITSATIDSHGSILIEDGLHNYQANAVIAVSTDCQFAAIWNPDGGCNYISSSGTLLKMICSEYDSYWILDPELMRFDEGHPFALIWLKSPAIIKFTISHLEDDMSAHYNAEEGMTWAEWCDSEYNTAGFAYSNSFIYDDNNYYLYDPQQYNDNVGGYCHPSNVIIAGRAYTTSDINA